MDDMWYYDGSGSVTYRMMLLSGDGHLFSERIKLLEAVLHTTLNMMSS